MFVTRKIGKVLRGKATTPQVVMATVLAGMLGFVPGFFLVRDLGGGFLQAPGLILALVFLVLVLNANLAVFGLTLVVAKLVSIPLLPVSFEVGRWLLDGPAQGLFRSLVNAPVLAWFGLERYATSGGVLLGLLFGVTAGLLLVRTLRSFRARMAAAEESSERFQKLNAKKSVRFLTWVFLGKGKGKTTYRELLDRQKKGLPVRIPGVVVVAVLLVGLWLGHSFLTGPGLRNALHGGLEQWNGATVDLERASVDLAAGELVFAGLAMADAKALERDSFRARSLSMTLDTGGLLSKRLVIDRIVSAEASSGRPREKPGQRIVKEPPPPPPPAGPGKTIDDYLKQAEQWRERLQQVSRWLQQLAGGDEAPADATPAERERRIDREAELYGLAQVVASHLLTEQPLLLVRSVLLEGVVAVDLGGDLLDIRASNLSTNPRLVAEPLQLEITSRSGAFAFSFAADAAGARTARTSFVWKGLSVDKVAAQLGSSPISGGTMDLSLSGSLDCGRPEGVWLDLPLQVQLRGTTLSLPGLQPTAVEQFALPLGVRGPLAAPRVSVDDQALTDALVAAGRKELADQVRARAQALLGGKVPGVADELGNLVEGTKTPEQLLEEAKQKAEEEARKQAEEARKKAEEELRKKAEEEAKKLLPGGLFGGKKG